MNATSYSRYLEAKKTVDDRSINQNVWNSFLSCLNQLCTDRNVRLLEIGAGTGNTLFNILDTNTCDNIYYTVVDIQPAHIYKLLNKVEGWASKNGAIAVNNEQQVDITLGGREIIIQLIVSDIKEYLDANKLERNYHAVIGQAILDLLDINELLPQLRDVVVEDGVFYFPVNYDGLSALLPYYDKDIDEIVAAIYHDSMHRNGVDCSQTGRQLLLYFLNERMPILDTGSSDWIVIPDHNGDYIGDEKYFLEHILYFVKSELAKSERIPSNVVKEWSSFRDRQIRRGELVYIAHQLDVLASNSS